MPDLGLGAIDLLRDFTWLEIAAVAAILVALIGILGITLRYSRTSDLTRDELRLLKAFNEQAEGDPRAYLSVELAVYRAEVDRYETKLRRLKALGYLQDSNIKEGHLGHRRVWITPEGIQRAQQRR
jgi:hypothetical protein